MDKGTSSGRAGTAGRAGDRTPLGLLVDGRDNSTKNPMSHADTPLRQRPFISRQRHASSNSTMDGRADSGAADATKRASPEPRRLRRCIPLWFTSLPHRNRLARRCLLCLNQASSYHEGEGIAQSAATYQLSDDAKIRILSSTLGWDCCSQIPADFVAVHSPCSVVETRPAVTVLEEFGLAIGPAEGSTAPQWAEQKLLLMMRRLVNQPRPAAMLRLPSEPGAFNLQLPRAACCSGRRPQLTFATPSDTRPRDAL
ncbi:hypothetical protein B0J12DRAFT_260297 [Macrophomina phaseolina]|uniref:Uncharacterized protein n=1 Tax=Macrophomina phaseolina TaxID=35725 RepID=A0ABQ8FYZ8_9PEZI|nr:hypothetical protein B0J12DRAFT_260297 [Macrophomina phaseolina]